MATWALIKLTYLYVINNKLTELASITKLTKLEKLYAGGNNIQVCILSNNTTRAPKFGPLRPQTRDSACMSSQVWYIEFLFEIFDHMINSRRIRKFGSSWFDARWSQTIRTRRFYPFFLFEMDQTCVFDENLSCDQKIRRKSQWTKLVTVCICCHVMEEVVDQTWDPRVVLFLFYPSLGFKQKKASFS